MDTNNKHYVKRNINWILPTIVSLFIAALGAYQTYCYNHKSLAYDLVDAKWLTHNDTKTKKIKILFDGDEVANDILITTVKFVNNGKVPIDKSDFDSPISISFSDETNLLDAITCDKTPSTLNVAYVVNSNKLTFKPLLLNPGDSFSLNILTDGAKGKSHIDYRIRGVKSITNLDSNKSNKRFVTILYSTCYIICAISMSIIFFKLTRILRSGSVNLNKLESLLLITASYMGSASFLIHLQYFLNGKSSMYFTFLSLYSITIIVYALYRHLEKKYQSA